MDWGPFFAGATMQFPMGEVQIQSMPFGVATVPFMAGVPLGQPPAGHAAGSQAAPGQAAPGQPSQGQTAPAQATPAQGASPGQQRPSLLRRQRPPPHPGQPEVRAPTPLVGKC